MNAPQANRLAKPLAIGLCVLAAFAVVSAVYVAGTPMQQRRARIDERRIDMLRTLVGEIEAHAKRREALPPSLDALARPGLRLQARDPDTGAAFGYRIIDARTYELCADFATDSAEVTDEYRPDSPWAHGAGRHCFEHKLPARDQSAAAAVP